MTKWLYESEEKDPAKYWSSVKLGSVKLGRDRKRIHVNNYLSAVVLALAAVVVVLHPSMI